MSKTGLPHIEDSKISIMRRKSAPSSLTQLTNREEQYFVVFFPFCVFGFFCLYMTVRHRSVRKSDEFAALAVRRTPSVLCLSCVNVCLLIQHDMRIGDDSPFSRWTKCKSKNTPQFFTSILFPIYPLNKRTTESHVCVFLSSLSFCHIHPHIL